MVYIVSFSSKACVVVRHSHIFWNALTRYLNSIMIMWSVVCSQDGESWDDVKEWRSWFSTYGKMTINDPTFLPCPVKLTQNPCLTAIVTLMTFSSKDFEFVSDWNIIPFEYVVSVFIFLIFNFLKKFEKCRLCRYMT